MCKIEPIDVNCKINCFEITKDVKKILIKNLNIQLDQCVIKLEYNADRGVYEFNIENSSFFNKIVELLDICSNLEFTNYILKEVFKIESGKGYINKDSDIDNGEEYYYVNMPYRNYIDYSCKKI